MTQHQKTGEKLESWVRDHYSASTFNTCLHQSLHTMSGKPMEINFKPDTTPHAVHCPIPIPHHWKKVLKADLDRDVSLGIIEPVPQGTPTTWCSCMVVAPKKDGFPRRTVNLQKHNQATLRETHHILSNFNQVSTIPPHTKETVLDAWNGYHSLPCHLRPMMSLLLSLSGGVICVSPWDTRLRGIPTQEDLMISLWTCHE